MLVPDSISDGNDFGVLAGEIVAFGENVTAEGAGDFDVIFHDDSSLPDLDVGANYFDEVDKG